MASHRREEQQKCQLVVGRGIKQRAQSHHLGAKHLGELGIGLVRDELVSQGACAVDDAGDGTPTRAGLRHRIGHCARVADVHNKIARLAADAADGLQGAADLAPGQNGGHTAAQLGWAGGLTFALGFGQQHALELRITFDPVTARGLVFHRGAAEQEKAATGSARQFNHAGRGHAAGPARDHDHRLRIERQWR